MILSPVQEKIVSTQGNLIVRASAGTGKTHTMVNKIAKETTDNRSHKVVAAITFTIKAAQEIKERLVIDTNQHFIGTNNSFAIEEIIKPFMKDVYGEEYNIDMDTDYALKVNTYQEGLDKIKNEHTLCSYQNTKENFIFELAYNIVLKSRACQLYLKAKYFKIYIDEYQDCDRTMHDFFMYLCDELKIDTFVVGDEKQSIYIWRGAYPEAFKSIWEKENFEKIFMGDNFRSSQQIQNYSNLLCEETRELYKATEIADDIIWISPDRVNYANEILSYIDPSKTSALLRFSKDNAKKYAEALTNAGLEYVYIPQTPIADISTETAWLYTAIAKYIILTRYSVYDLISEIPAEGDERIKAVSKIEGMLVKCKENSNNETLFKYSANKLAKHLGYETREEDLKKLYQTISDKKYYPAYDAESFKHIAITFHSSKGLEFEQVIVFAEDYRLSDMPSIYNHYVAVTRAKSKLIIVKSTDYNANCFQVNLQKLFRQSSVELTDVITIR